MPLANLDWSSFGAQLDPTLVLQQVKTMGYNVRWLRAMACPNRVNSDRTAHDINCRVCDGSSFLYDSGRPVKMLVTSISVRQAYMMQGRIDLGMAMFTTEPEHQMSWWDKIELTETTIRYTEVVVRTAAGVVDKLKYSIIDAADVRGVLRLVRSDGVELALDTDFSIVNGNIQWAVDPGAITYSVAYLIRPTYMVLDVTHHARTLPTFGPRGINTRGPERTIAFPVMGIGKLDFLLSQDARVAE